MQSASEMHDTKFYFLREKDQKIVTRDFIVSVVYDFFELFFLFKVQHIFCFLFQKHSLKAKEFEYAFFLYFRA